MYKLNKIRIAPLNLLVVLLVVLLLLLCFYDFGNANEITIGGATRDTCDTGPFSEYSGVDSKDSNLFLGGKLSYPGDKYRINFHGNYQGGDTQAYGGNVDLNRIFQIETDYIRFLHRLDHDNLDHMLATLKLSSQGATLYHTDFNESDDYTITRSTWKTHAKLNIPDVPGLVLTFDNKYDTRKGMEQARTMSKCASCHVVGRSKTINEVTQEFNPGISYTMGLFEIEYKFSYRIFDAKGDDPSNLYMKTQHPGTGKNPDFAQRMQFDDGAFDFSRTPDSTKLAHKVKLKANTKNPANLGFIYSKATNNSSDGGGSALNGDIGEELEIDYWAVNGGWHWRISKKVSATIKGKYYEQDADDAFINVNDQIIVDGRPGAGSTYADFLETDFDYNRKSAYNQRKWITDTKLAWKLSKKLKMKFGYNVEYLDRESAEAHHVTDDTTTHKLSVGSKWRPKRGVRVNMDYAYTYVDNPYLFHKAMCPEQDDAYTPGTYNKDSWYSKYVYGMRTASATNRPGEVHEAKVKLYWAATNKLTSNIYTRYKYALNNDTGLNDWEQNMFNGGVGFVYNLTSKTGVNFGYNYFYDKYDATFCSAFYHG